MHSIWGRRTKQWIMDYRELRSTSQTRKEFFQAIRMTGHPVIAQHHLRPNSKLPKDLPRAWNQWEHWSLRQSSWFTTLACDWTSLLILNITRAQQRHLETAACRPLTLSKSKVNILEAWKPVRILQKKSSWSQEGSLWFLTLEGKW